MADTLLERTPRDQLSGDARMAWDMLNKLTEEPTFVEVFANAPELLDFVMKRFYGDIFFAGRVDQKYKQLVRLRLSQIHGCRTCNRQNVPATLEVGVSREQVEAMNDGDYSSFSEAEAAVLRFAEQMALTNPDGRMDKDLYESLSRHFSTAEICELGTVMAVVGGFAKLSFVMDLVEREEYCPFAREN